VGAERFLAEIKKSPLSRARCGAWSANVSVRVDLLEGA